MAGYSQGLAAIGAGRADLEERDRMAAAVGSGGGIVRAPQRIRRSMFDEQDTGLAGIRSPDDALELTGGVAAGPGGAARFASAQPVGMPVGMTEEIAEQAIPLVQRVTQSMQKNLGGKPTKAGTKKFNKDFVDTVYIGAENDTNPNKPLMTAAFNAGNIGGLKSAGSFRVENVNGEPTYVAYDMEGNRLENAPYFPVKRRNQGVTDAGKAIRTYYQNQTKNELATGLSGESASPGAKASLAEAYVNQGMSVNQAIAAADQAEETIRRGVGIGEEDGAGITSSELNRRLIGLAGAAVPQETGIAQAEPPPARGHMVIGDQVAHRFGDAHPLAAAMNKSSASATEPTGSAAVQPEPIQGQRSAETGYPEVSLPPGAQTVAEPAPLEGEFIPAAQSASTVDFPRTPVSPPRPESRSFAERNPEIAGGLASVRDTIGAGLGAVGDYVGGKLSDAAQKRRDFDEFQKRWLANDVQQNELEDYVRMGVSLFPYIDDPQQRQFIMEEARRLGIMDGIGADLSRSMVADR